jgi:hypothetical protein
MVTFIKEKEDKPVSIHLSKPEIEKLTTQKVVDMRVWGKNIRFLLENGFTITIPNWQ